MAAVISRKEHTRSGFCVVHPWAGSFGTFSAAAARLEVPVRTACVVVGETEFVSSFRWMAVSRY